MTKPLAVIKIAIFTDMKESLLTRSVGNDSPLRRWAQCAIVTINIAKTLQKSKYSIRFAWLIISPFIFGYFLISTNGIRCPSNILYNILLDYYGINGRELMGAVTPSLESAGLVQTVKVTVPQVVEVV